MGSDPVVPLPNGSDAPLLANWDSSLLLGAEHQGPFRRHPVGRNITGNFFFLHCKGRKIYTFSLVVDSAVHLEMSRK